jgi:hypothetical protein
MYHTLALSTIIRIEFPQKQNIEIPSLVSEIKHMYGNTYVSSSYTLILHFVHKTYKNNFAQLTLRETGVSI